MHEPGRGQPEKNALDFDAAARVLRDVHASDHAETVIPGYVIDRLVGQGGGGRVFRAFRVGSDQAVALKVLTAGIGSGAIAARVWREIELLESLRIPGLARLLDHGTHHGRVYIATEFIEGQTLGEAMSALWDKSARAGAWAASVRELDADAQLASLVDVLVKMADAVQSIHERGVIHRDIKPSNVIVMDDATPVLVDFGLARLQEDSSQTLTTEGAAIGTPAFMSPEQARGDRSQISTRSDVWSLAATGCWMLTGEAPFDTNCSLHEALRRVSHEMPREPGSLRKDLPRALGAVISKATSRQSEARYASAGQFADDLRRWRRGEPVTAAPMGRWQRATTWIGRHPIIGTAVASSLVGVGILVGVAGFVAWGLMKPMRMRFIGNAGCVEITSGFGSVLAQWDTGRKGGMPDPILTRAPDGTRVLVMGFRLPPIGHEGIGADLLAVDFNRDGKKLWCSSDPERQPHMPSKGGDTRQQDDYVISAFCAADVFAEPAGDELIVLHANSAYSGSCIRVYSLAGEVLSEVWHHGQLKDVAWIADETPGEGALGVAVVGGVNSEHTYTQLGATDALGGCNPPVVFAIRPQRGSFEWIATPTQPDPFGTHDVQPAWYRYLCPPKWASRTVPELMRFESETRRHIQPVRLGVVFSVDAREPSAAPGPHWMIHRDGPDSAALSSNTYGDRKDAPPIEVWKWSDRPK